MRRLLASAVVFTALIAGLWHAPGTAEAAPASRHVVSGELHSCYYRYVWYVSTVDAYTYVEWTNNVCRFAIQSKADFTNIGENHYTNYSGYCRSTGVQCKVSANSVFDSINEAWRRINFGVNWYPWREYWHG